MITTINPTTAKELAQYSLHSSATINEMIEQLSEEQKRWSNTSVSIRISALERCIEILSLKKEMFAQLITEEMGKPIVEAEAEVEKCKTVCRFYMEHMELFLKPETMITEATKSYVRYEPMGLILAIMPWNYPFWQVFRFAIPALASGNGVVLKHAPNVSGCSLALDQLFRESELPFCSLIVDTSDVEGLIAHEAVKKITLTGSSRAGAAVASIAGKHLKPCVLELGGSDPFIILEDADLQAVIPAAIKARNQNNGQSCIAGKRFFIHKEIKEEFTAEYLKGLRELKIGHPQSRETNIGPIARHDLFENLVSQVDMLTDQGAVILQGCTPAEGKGYFYVPGAIDVSALSFPFREELFGPVALFSSFTAIDEAIHMANHSPYGLGASIWTKDAMSAEKNIAPYLDCGMVFINDVVHSDSRMPFGGVKASGYGRELGLWGFREFCTTKSYWIKS